MSKTFFPATEASIVDPLNVDDFHASGGGQKKLTFNQYRICAKVELELYLRRKNCDDECRKIKELFGQNRRPRSTNKQVEQEPVQMQATCICGHMFFPACGLRPTPANEPTIKAWRKGHEGRAEKEIARIREEYRNAFVIAPFKWNGYMTNGTDLLEATRLRGFSNQWCTHTQLYSKEQENTEPQLHAPANTELLEEVLAAKKPPPVPNDGWEPEDQDRDIDDMDKYDENSREAARAILEASRFIATV